MNYRPMWLKGLSAGREHEFPRWREVCPDGGWHDWWNEDGLYGCLVWPDDDGEVDQGAQSLS